MSDHSAADESFEVLYERAPCGLFSTSPAGVIVRANETFLRMGGFRRDDVIGRPFEQLLVPGSQLYLHTQYQLALMLDGSVSEVDLSLRHSDGSTVPVVVNATMHGADDGTPGTVRTAVFEASKRGNYARELLDARRSAERAEQRVHVLEGASGILGTADTESELVDSVGEVVRQAFDAFDARLMLATGDAIAATDGGGGEHVISRDALWPPSAQVNDIAVVTTTQLVESQPEFGRALAAQRVHSLVVCPVRDGDAVVGMLVSFFRRQRDLEANEREMFCTLGRFSGQVLTRIRLQNQLRNAALHDQLTGLANRTLLTQRLEQAHSSAVRHHRPLALLYLDLDGFKQINDTLGHACGDAVLIQTADRLRSVIRASDTIARVGGDEFVMVCVDAGPDEVSTIITRIQDAFRTQFDGVTREFRVTASIGVALLEPGGLCPSPDDLLREADAAMYESKRLGKNRETVVSV